MLENGGTEYKRVPTHRSHLNVQLIPLSLAGHTLNYTKILPAGNCGYRAVPVKSKSGLKTSSCFKCSAFSSLSTALRKQKSETVSLLWKGLPGQTLSVFLGAEG